MLMRGQAEPSDLASGALRGSSFQGQPVFPLGGEGNSVRVGRHIEASLISPSLIGVLSNSRALAPAIFANLG